ncbi:type II toxin-antitoxin system RelE/ParE family toxin [Bifidobacterium myosotis]|uniref:type II toxin-antitoxin system RelE/ParE family toxin n=1 Tax=Bifidobacterium myosotis TaxID=1630166 RepID=UPI001CC30798|nr:type II toxin-antitoxin system RelE/ParE family toxin [Bifidobacterium myosotis]
MRGAELGEWHLCLPKCSPWDTIVIWRSKPPTNSTTGSSPSKTARTATGSSRASDNARSPAGRSATSTPSARGVSELRYHFGPGYRVYFAQKADVLILLLAGGTKRGQQTDIDHAHDLLRTLKEEHQW